MCEAAELTEPQRQELRKQLVTLRDELRQNLSLSADGEKPVDLEEPIGRLSRMDAIQQQKMIKASRARLKKRLHLIETILAGDSQEYGICRVCEEPVGYRRLVAKPESLLCRDCQGASERR